MEPQFLVQDVVIEFDGQPRRATYFVEHGVIRMTIDGRAFMLAAGPDNPESTVRAVLLEHYLQKRKGD